MNKQEILIRNLKNLMNDYHLNQGQLAQKIGVHQVTISQVVNGKKPFSLSLVIKVCNAFNIDVEEFQKPDAKQFGFVEDKQDSNKDSIMQMQSFCWE